MGFLKDKSTLPTFLHSNRGNIKANAKTRREYRGGAEIRREKKPLRILCALSDIGFFDDAKCFLLI
jgi:hypothetical protein